MPSIEDRRTRPEWPRTLAMLHTVGYRNAEIARMFRTSTEEIDADLALPSVLEIIYDIRDALVRSRALILESLPKITQLQIAKALDSGDKDCTRVALSLMQMAGLAVPQEIVVQQHHTHEVSGEAADEMVALVRDIRDSFERRRALLAEPSRVLIGEAALPRATADTTG